MVPLLLSVLLLAPSVASQAPAGEFDRLVAQAVQLQQAGDIVGAIDAYTAALRIEPNHADVRSNLGAAYAKLGKYDEALEQYREALRIDSGNATVLFNLGLAYYKGARFADAVETFEKVLAASPDNRAAVLLLGDALLQTGQFQQVIDVLSPRAGQFESDLGYAYVLGTALLRAGERVRAQAYLDRIFRAGESAEAHLLMAIALVDTRNFTGAIEECRKALALKPDLPTLRTVYARALLASGDPDGAMRELQRAVVATPNDFDANLQLGALLRRDERHRDSAIYLRRAVQLRPQDPTARFALAGALLSLNELEESRQMLEGVVSDAPDYTEAHVLLATCYYRLKRKDDGDRHKAIAERLREKEQARQPRPESGGR